MNDSHPSAFQGDIIATVPVVFLFPVSSLDARTPEEARAFAEECLRDANLTALIEGVEIPFRIQQNETALTQSSAQ